MRLYFAACVLLRSKGRAKERFLAEDFFVKICLRPCLCLTSFPVPVTLNLAFIALLVFIFGTGGGSLYLYYFFFAPGANIVVKDLPNNLAGDSGVAISAS